MKMFQEGDRVFCSSLLKDVTILKLNTEANVTKTLITVDECGKRDFVRINTIFKNKEECIKYLEEYKEFDIPKTFGEVCEMQKFLDKKIEESKKEVKERNLNQIFLSIIAEAIEFNEELECSHKTWKTKKIDKRKQLEEFVDMLFFIAQLPIPLYEGYAILDKRIDEVLANNYKNATVNCALVNMVKSTNASGFIYWWSVIANKMGYTKEQIFKEYYRKFNINLKRIKGEWK